MLATAVPRITHKLLRQGFAHRTRRYHGGLPWSCAASPVIVGLLVAGLLGVWPASSWGQGNDDLPPPAPQWGGEIHGTVLAQVDKGLPIPLPDIWVQLEDASQIAIDRVMTDGFGRYRFRRQSPGKYLLVWRDPDWAVRQVGEPTAAKHETSSAEPVQQAIPVEVENETYHADPIIIHRKPMTDGPTISGTLKMGDGSSPWICDKSFGIEQKAAVRFTAENGREPAKVSPTNAYGEFVATGLPRGDITVRAKLVQRLASDSAPRWADVPGQEVSKIVSHSDFSRDGVFRTEMAFPNSPPALRQVTVTNDKGEVVSNPAPGQVVICEAEFRDNDPGDKVTCIWKVSDATELRTGNPLRWKLPNNEGRQTSYVLITDGKGGYARGSVNLPVTAPLTTFLSPQERP